MLLLSAFGAFELIARIKTAQKEKENITKANSPDISQPQPPAGAARGPIRLVAGYQGSQELIVPEHTPDPNLYARERFGHFTYSILVDTRSRYTLVLHFAELYWIPDPSGSVGVGSRVFRVYCNGSTLLDNFDIFKEAGSLHALTKTFYHLRPSPEGKLDLTFDPITNYATVPAIEVIDKSQ